MSRLVTDSFALTETSNGNVYQFASGPVTLAAGNKDLLFVTGSTEVIVLAVQLITNGDDITAAGYKGTVATGGTMVPLQNKNLCSHKQAEVQLFDSPTVDTVGTLLTSKSSYGSNQMPQRIVNIASLVDNDIYILAPYSKYLFRLISSGTTTANFTLTIAESNYIEN